ncbi:MAG: endonuclease, partial [Bacteroidales bacterium]|nr:endonuclease [Bacteroidales bacterium]
APPFAASLAVPSTAVAASTPAQSAAPGTIKYHGRWEQIDHFFVSPTMEGHMQIFAPPFLLEDDPAYLGTKPRRTYIGPRYHGGLSDHLPIIFKTEGD